jgi:glycyl-tRNA synthetase beta chain
MEVKLVDSLLEIYLEDLPPSEFPNLLNSMKSKMEDLLRRESLSFESVETGMTVRRLYVLIKGLEEKQLDRTVEKKGPPESVAFKDGKPTKALEGFLKKFGAGLEDIEIRDGYVYAKKVITGMKTPEVLKKLLPEYIENLEFKKPMKWGNGDYEFVRPVHGILALLDSEIVEFEMFGLKSGNKTYGHRFFGKEITVKKPQEYKKALKDEFVIVDLEERKKFVEDQLKHNDLEVDKDEDLIMEVVYLTEYPKAVIGNFDEKYLSLPKEIIITTVKHHERTFATFKGGRVTTTFIGFQDGPQDSDNIRTGFEKVINARLEDARYYFEKDLNSSFEEWNENLKGIVFQKKLGSLYDKVLRIKEIALEISKSIGYNELNKIERAALISKADIASKMVYEFPELQGVMGRIYALRWGEDEDIAWAIQEQYEEEPERIIGGILGIADRIDTIVGNFLVGNIPSGSKDPYGLRQKADAVYSIIRKFKWDLNLIELISLAKKLVGLEGEDENIYDFMKSRFRAFLEGSRIEWDVARAVEHVWKTPLRGILSAEALNDIVNSDDIADLRVGFERVHNMTSKHDSRDYDGALLKEEAEIELMNAFFDVKSKVLKALENLDYRSAYSYLISLKPFIDKYFNEVFVMVGREDLRRSRLGFLKNVDDLFMMVADLTKISKDRVLK